MTISVAGPTGIARSCRRVRPLAALQGRAVWKAWSNPLNHRTWPLTGAARLRTHSARRGEHPSYLSSDELPEPLHHKFSPIVAAAQMGAHAALSLSPLR